LLLNRTFQTAAKTAAHPSDENRAAQRKSIGHAIAAWVAFFARYLLFAGTGEPAELAAGGFCAALVAAVETALRTRNERPLYVSLSMLYPLVPASGRLVLDAFRVGHALPAAFRLPPCGSFSMIAASPGADAGGPAGWAIAVAPPRLHPMPLSSATARSAAVSPSISWLPDRRRTR
jgi:hypothetical protein